MTSQKTLEETIQWITRKISLKINVPPGNIDIDEDMMSYGLDSVEAVGLVGELEGWCGKEIPATAMWDYPTIRQLATFVHSDEGDVNDG